MREYKVWSSVIDLGLRNGWKILGACPPGGSVYAYNRCCLIDQATGKRDEPDIMFASSTTLIIVECKPRLSQLIKKASASNEESDIEKLLRIYDNYMAGKYREQLLQNYDLNQDSYEIKLAIGYAKGKKDPAFCDDRFHLFAI